MRKLYTLLLLLTIASGVSAQTDLTGQTITLLAESDSTLLETGTVRVYNINSTDREILVRRRLNNVVPNTINYFCWTVCYGPGTNVSPSHITIPAGGASDDFHGYYDPSKNPGNSLITYVFFDKNNPADSVWFKVNYTTSGVPDTLVDPFINLDFSAGLKKSSSFRSTAYPNPASDLINFESSERVTSVSVVDVLGNVVKRNSIPQVSKVSVNVADLAPGVYFCNFYKEGSLTGTRKFTVKR